MQEKQVAVLVDGDNISPRYAEYIKQEAAMLGRIKIFRLYGSIGASTVKATTLSLESKSASNR
mgnify:CR=1 FL=1